jgi:hypothetical protein
MAIIAISRDWGSNPCIVRIVSTDDLATVSASGYILDQDANIRALNEGEFEWVDTDFVLVSASDGWGLFSISSDFDSLTPFALSTTIVGAPVVIGNIPFFQSTSGNLEDSGYNVDNLLLMASVNITAAEFNGMYAAPKLLIAAPGANELIVVERMELIMTYGAAAFASGGVVAAQYDSTVHGAGALATNSEAAADFFAAASTTFMFNGNAGNTVGAVPFSTSVNKGLYLSNATGAFTTGDSTFVCKVHYRIVPSAVIG